MADGTIINAGSGGDVIATDDLTTLNGGVVSGVKAQRMKVGFGSDASLRDVDTSNGLPVDQRTIAGTAVDTNSGSKSAGTQRVVLATDQPALTTAGLMSVKIDQTTPGTTNLVALAANQSVNNAQVGGAAVSTGNGVSGTGVQRVSIASDSTGNIATIGTSITPGTAATNLGKAEDQASVDADVGVATLMIRKAAPANTSGTDGDYEFGQMNAGRQWVWAQPNIVTISTTITRPADTNAYAANDVFANSTTSPTSGGYTLSGAALVSGGSGLIKDLVVSASGGTNYSGEIWIFDQAVTAKNDNAAFDVSDSEVQNLVGVIPFQTSNTTSSNAVSYTTGLEIPYTCVGSANLRFLVKILGAVTPASAEVLAVRVKVAN